MEGAFIHETATAEKGSTIGSGTKVWHYAHVREGAILGKNCVVGHCAYVGQDVKVGNNVKIENKVSIFKGATIEDDVFIGPHVAFQRPEAKGARREMGCHGDNSQERGIHRGQLDDNMRRDDWQPFHDRRGKRCDNGRSGPRPRLRESGQA